MFKEYFMDEYKESEERIPKNLVEVRFDGGLKLSYYNDLEGVKVGSLVTVTGKKSGEICTVVKVLSTFKAPKFEMQWIDEIIETDLTGSYFSIKKDVFSFDSNLTAKQFLSVMSRDKYEPSKIFGDGEIEIDLENLESCELFDNELIKERGLEIYKNQMVRFISLKNGQGKAVVLGTNWYEIDFKYKKGKITSLLCDCPYFTNCKHSYAFLLKFREVLKSLKEMGKEKDFVMIQKENFAFFLSIASGKISLDYSR